MFSVDKLNRIATPYYYYDTQLLRDTLEVIKRNVISMTIFTFTML